jgi:GNAT superfamily N-acetyltransferase
MLVRLYDLDRYARRAQAGRPASVVFRPAMPYERSRVRDWISHRFSRGWADEFEMTFHRHPASTTLAVEDGRLLGFACFDATAPGFFGPTGVDADERGRGIGLTLLIDALQRMRHAGYGYAIIGGVGPIAFYEQAVGAEVIAHSDPGVYHHRLAPDTKPNETRETNA